MTTDDLFAAGPEGPGEAAKPETPAVTWTEVRAWLSAHPTVLAEDRELLSTLGLRPAPKGDNVIEFGRAALTKLEAVAAREQGARKQIEQIARANFAAQAQTHAAVVDLLESRNHADLARRLDHAARTRFSLVTGVIALEGPAKVPFGWRALEDGSVDYLLGEDGLARLGPDLAVEALFGDQTDEIGSAAVVRLALWHDHRPAVVAFGAADANAFQPEMGAELVAFVARVVERTAERWPVL